jgi:hypothetical protein
MSLTSISNTEAVATCCPKKLFESLDGYISLVHQLDNIPKSSHKSINTRTIGTITIVENNEQTSIRIARNGNDLYSAWMRNGNWLIETNCLENHEISIVLHLPKTKEQLFAEFYGRRLTHKLKELFKKQNYPIGQQIGFYNTPKPYTFCISDESNPEKIVFLGCNCSQKTVFKSCFYHNQAIFIPLSSLPFSHLNQLASCR